METNAVSANIAALGPNNTPSQAAQSSAGLAQDFDTFLTLLTAQLQNQDPLDPTDTNEFTRQIVSFAGVEQQIRANDQLEQLAKSNQLTNSIGFVGHSALLYGRFVEVQPSETVHRWQYNLSSDAKDVTFRIVDDGGREVFGFTAENVKAGEQDFYWDGLDKDGEPVQPGLYSLEVSGNDALEPSQQVFGAVNAVDRVESVTLQGDTPQLRIAGDDYTPEQILSLIAN